MHLNKTLLKQWLDKEINLIIFLFDRRIKRNIDPKSSAKPKFSFASPTIFFNRTYPMLRNKYITSKNIFKFMSFSNK